MTEADEVQSDKPVRRAYLPGGPAEDPDGRLAATGALVEATRQLMQQAPRTQVPTESLLAAAAAIERVVESLGQPADQLMRVPFNEAAVRRIKAGATWMMAPYNPMTVPMEIHFADGRACAEFVPGPLLEGPPGLLHGGFAAHLLDALLGALIQVQGRPGYTVGLDLTFLRPTELNRPIRVEGVVGESEGRKMRAVGTISQDGQRTVEARALFVQPPPGAPAIE